MWRRVLKVSPTASLTTKVKCRPLYHKQQEQPDFDMLGVIVINLLLLFIDHPAAVINHKLYVLPKLECSLSSPSQSIKAKPRDWKKIERQQHFVVIMHSSKKAPGSIGWPVFATWQKMIDLEHQAVLLKGAKAYF